MFDATTDIKLVVQAFAECWNRHDMKAFAKLFAPNAEFIDVVGLWMKGRDEIKKAYEFTHAKRFKNSQLTVSDVSIRFPSENIATAKCRWVLERHVSPDNKCLPARHGILVLVLSRNSKTWSIIDSKNIDIIEGVSSHPQ